MMKNIGYVKPKKNNDNGFKNFVIAAFVFISVAMRSVAISAQASKNILQRDYEYLVNRYAELYIHSLSTSNQD